MIKSVTKELHDTILTARSIERIITSDRFIFLWKRASRQSKILVENYIKSLNKDLIENWMNNQKSQDLKDLNIRELKDVARVLRISNWSRMHKPDLIINIISKEEEMALSKVTMVDDMREKIKEMALLITESGIPEDALNVPDMSVDLKATLIRPAFAWIATIHATEYAEFLEVRKLCTEEIWARYKSWGYEDFTDHREVQMLTAILKKFKKTILSKKRPDFFKKSMINKEIRAWKKQLKNQ